MRKLALGQWVCVNVCVCVCVCVKERERERRIERTTNCVYKRGDLMLANERKYQRERGERVGGES